MTTQVIFQYSYLSETLTHWYRPLSYSVIDSVTMQAAFNIDIPPDTSLYIPFRVNAITPNSLDYFRVDSYVLDNSSGFNVYTLTGEIVSPWSIKNLENKLYLLLV